MLFALYQWSSFLFAHCLEHKAKFWHASLSNYVYFYFIFFLTGNSPYKTEQQEELTKPHHETTVPLLLKGLERRPLSQLRSGVNMSPFLKNGCLLLSDITTVYFRLLPHLLGVPSYIYFLSLLLCFALFYLNLLLTCEICALGNMKLLLSQVLAVVLQALHAELVICSHVSWKQTIKT